MSLFEELTYQDKAELVDMFFDALGHQAAPGALNVWQGECGHYLIPDELLDGVVWRDDGSPDPECDAYKRLETWAAEKDEARKSEV